MTNTEVAVCKRVRWGGPLSWRFEMNIIRKISLSSAMAALATILNLLSVRTDTNLYSIYALPILITGILYGPLVGGLTGFTTGFIVQIFTYGLTPTTILWLLAPISWGLISGLISMLFKYKTNKIIIAIEVFVSSIIALVLNSVGMILDGLIYNYSTAFVYTGILLRFGISLLVGIFYFAVLSIVIPRLLFLRQK